MGGPTPSQSLGIANTPTTISFCADTCFRAKSLSGIANTPTTITIRASFRFTFCANTCWSLSGIVNTPTTITVSASTNFISPHSRSCS